MRYEERGQGYRDVEKVGKHCSRMLLILFLQRGHLIVYSKMTAVCAI